VKRPSSTLIGAFVLGAISLLAVALVLLGSGKLFRRTHEFVIYFPGSVNGLQEGAPVKFKGVEIGTVDRIRIRLGMEQVPRIPVFISLDSEKLASGGAAVALDDPQAVDSLIQQGLRAQLQSQSLVTGILFVALDVFPSTPIERFAPPEVLVQEIPAVPTALEAAQRTVEELVRRLQEMDLEALFASLSRVASGLDQLVNSPELRESVASLDDTMRGLEQTLSNLREITGALRGRAGPLADELRATAASTRAAVDELDATLTAVRGFVDPDSPMAYEMAQAFHELSRAARSLRALADSLERNPSAVVFGKDGAEEER
jgi:paraquat-inducible protein B